MEVKITYRVDNHNLSSEVFLELVQQVWPGKYHTEMTEDALKKTTNITAWYKEKLIGCVRILTDGYYFGTITEILVLPEFRNKGIGKTLMELAWESTPTSLFIGVQPGNERFFEKLGFEKSIQSYQKKKARKK